MYKQTKKIKNLIDKKYPLFANNFKRQINLFGERWLDEFNSELEIFFKKDNSLLKALKGYVNFSLEAMKLQIKFNFTKEYENKTYAEASSKVYFSEEYMMDKYLPGLYLSHYLWKHHYQQQIFFYKNFLKYCSLTRRNFFFDIGIGTGFYSKKMLQALPNSIGLGFDLSPYSIRYANKVMKAFNVSNRYKILKQDITKKKPKELADYIICIEVLEHLENPQLFLRHLYKMMKKGGYGLISAAINASNQDHIYLYRNYKDVQKQLKIAGFKIIEYTNDKAYKPTSKSEIVPENVAFVVSK